MSRALARFFLLGALLLVGQRLLLSASPALPVRGGGDDELLLAYAVEQGWPAADAVVRQRLLALLAAVDQGPDALARALALGLHRSDPVARARLIASARRELAREATLSPAELTLVRLRALARAASLGKPALVRFRHVFLARQRRGDRLDEDARRLDPARDRGDPWPWSDVGVWTSVPRVTQTFGPALAHAVESAPLGRWIGPLASPYGAHFVIVDAREPALPCPPDRLEALIADERRTEARRRGLAEALGELRAGTVFTSSLVGAP